MSKKLWALFIVRGLGVSFGAGLLSVQVQIRSTGSIKAIGVSFSQSSIDWGRIGRGESKTVVLTCTNINNTAATLSMAPANWSPSSASSYLLLTWNCTGVVLQPQQSCHAAFTLNAADADLPFSSFAFDIFVTATES